METAGKNKYKFIFDKELRRNNAVYIFNEGKTIKHLRGNCYFI